MINYKFATIQEVKDLLDYEVPVAFDTETVGFYGKIRLAQFYQPHFECPILVEWPSALELVSVLSKAIVVAHNIHYDITTIQRNMNRMVWMPEKFHCTLLLSRLHFYTKEKFSLDEVIQYVLGNNPYGMTKKDMQASDWGAPVLSEDQKTYAALDVKCLWDVFDTVKSFEDDYSYKLDMLCLRYCLDFQNNGLPVDVERLTTRYGENANKIKDIGLPINCNSYQQVRKYINSTLSDDLGLSTLIAQGNERAKDVKDTRKLTKENSFLKKFMDTMEDGCIFGNFKPLARSGRTTSDDQNLQQLPRALKGIFGVDEEGDEVLIYSDFAQIQLRCVCAIANDKTMENLFRNGADLHNFVTEIIFGENYTKQDRTICKTANFGLLFGAGVETFQAILLKQAGMAISQEFGASLKKKWLNLWVDVAKWQESGIKDWRKGKAWETPLGRRYTAKMMTDQLAMQIQGFEAEVAKLAMHYMLPRMKELDTRVKLRNFVHDSFIFTAPKIPEIYEAAAEIIAESMKDAWIEMSQSVAISDLPMPVGVRVGYNWGDIEDDKFIYELKV